MDIRLTDDFELRDMDGLNWHVYELRDVTSKSDGTTRTEWVPTGHYFTRPQSAVSWVCGQLLHKRRKRAVVTLQDALRAIRDIAAEVDASARRIEAAANAMKEARR